MSFVVPQAGDLGATGVSPENMEAMRRGLPEVGALVCPRCGHPDCFVGPPGCGPLGGMRYAGSRLILTDAGRRVLEGGET